MGLVLDGDEFPMSSKIFERNITEASTLEQIIGHLGGLALSESPTVVMDAVIASEENMEWLKSKRLHYIVVSRKRYKQRQDKAQGAVVIKDEIDNHTNQIINRFCILVSFNNASNNNWLSCSLNARFFLWLKSRGLSALLTPDHRCL
jgi:transposase